jgi:rhodanese-related sulfurtransferase
MKRHRIFILNVFLISLSVLLTDCKGKKSESSSGTVESSQAGQDEKRSESMLLLKELEKNGDYVNSQNFPSLIKASVVFNELDSNNLIIDLRNRQDYDNGHIKGAVNVRFPDLPEYFESGIRPFEYNRIIMVCNDGQASSYTASLLRLMGYGNVFAMRWGMSGWNREYARNHWMKGVSGKFEDRLETNTNDTPSPSEMPELKTGLSDGQAILDNRFKEVFARGLDSVLISADEVFRDPSRFFIINFERKDKYEDGHIPGAVRYKPESTLGFADVMSTIPSDRSVVVYCGTGHNSGFATAFLRLCGYDARTLKYGNNGFMYEKMKNEKTALSWLPFTLNDSNDFPVVR